MIVIEFEKVFNGNFNSNSREAIFSFRGYRKREGRKREDKKLEIIETKENCYFPKS